MDKTAFWAGFEVLAKVRRFRSERDGSDLSDWAVFLLALLFLGPPLVFHIYARWYAEPPAEQPKDCKDLNARPGSRADGSHLAQIAGTAPTATDFLNRQDVALSYLREYSPFLQILANSDERLQRIDSGGRTS